MNGEGLEQGTLAATAMLITVVRLVKLVKLELKSSSVMISVGAGSLLSSVVRCLWNLSQSTIRQMSFGVSGLFSIEASRVVAIGKWSMHGGWRSGSIIHCVMIPRIPLLQKMLSGCVKFLVQVAHRVGMSLGSAIVMLKSARRSIRI